MKNIYNKVLLIGLLLLTAATVKAESKPDSATQSTSVKIKPVGTGYWNYLDAQLFVGAASAIPGFKPTAVFFENDSIAWLHFFGIISGHGANIYFHLEQEGDWWVLPAEGMPTVGGGAWSCSGSCSQAGDWDYEATCVNTRPGHMVLCGCQGAVPYPMADGAMCSFHQYPQSTALAMYNALHQIHD